jgi:hypothetical protein
MCKAIRDATDLSSHKSRDDALNFLSQIVTTPDAMGRHPMGQTAGAVFKYIHELIDKRSHCAVFVGSTEADKLSGPVARYLNNLAQASLAPLSCISPPSVAR